MSEARIHHYIPQCYLKGFTAGGGKKSKLTVFNRKDRSRFESIPRNVCGQRDYNRISIEGQDPNAIEKTYALIESELAKSLKSIIEGAPFAGDDKSNILYLMAMIVTRSPSQRKNWEQFEQRVLKQLMQLNVQTEGRWDSSVCQAGVNDELGDEAARKFVEDDAFSIGPTKEHQIELEMKATDVVFDNLTPRGWRVLRVNQKISPFITSDLPVHLFWTDMGSNPSLFHRPPGFGLMGTTVVFPISRNVTVLGTFEDKKDIEVDLDLHSVATINSLILTRYERFVMASSRDFKCLAADGSIVNGQTFLENVDQAKPAT